LNRVFINFLSAVINNNIFFMKKFAIFATVLLSFFGVMAMSASAATYYVAKNGNNANPGTLASPWLTIGKAANTLVAGDTVLIRTGTYNEQVVPARSGSAGAYITYQAYPGETVTVDGTNTFGYDWDGIFSFVKRSYLQIKNFRIVNSRGFGIFLTGSSNVIIDGNYTYNTGYSGIWVGDNSNTVTVNGNEIVHANTKPNQESLSISGSHYVTISNNIVHDGLKEGIDAKGSTNVKIFGNLVYDMAGMGIYIDSYLNTPLNIEIYNNIVRDSKGTGFQSSSRDGIILAAENGNIIDGVKIYNNTISNIAWNGILLSYFHYAGTSEPQHKNISIYNNTIHGTSKAGAGTGGGINVQGSSNTNVIVRNNIVSEAGSFNIVTMSGTTISHNLFNGGTPAGTNYVAGNPLFVNAGVADFHIQSGSPAINAGYLTGAPTTDISGAARSGNPDIGAYEYGGTTPPPSGLPDVIVTSLTYDAATGLFTSVVKNQGTAATPAGAVIGVGYFVDGIQQTWGDLNTSIAAGASVTVSTRGGAYTIPSGVHTIMAHVNDANYFVESNKDNNQYSTTVGATPLPDVIVTSLTYDTATGLFTSVVKNQGTVATPAGVVIGVGYFVDGTQRTWGDLNSSIAAGASATIGSRGGAYTIPSGTHTIMAHADDTNLFAESNETNNQLSQSITVGTVGDPTPPTTPGTPTASAITSSSLTLNWTASWDAVGVTGYKIFRGGVQIGTSATNSYSDTGLTSSTAYTYTVSAYDAAGYNSAISEPLTVTTLAATTNTLTITTTRNSNYALGYSTAYTSLAQSFKLPIAGKVTSVKATLRKVGAPTSPITIALRSSLTGADIATGTIAPSSLTTSFAWITAPLTGSPTLTAGTTYYLVFSTSGISTKNYYRMGVNTANPYADGTFYLKTVAQSAYDATAEILYTSGGGTSPTATVSANPTSITSGQSSTLTWSSTNASSCIGTNFSTGGATSNAIGVVVSPAVTTTYTITCGTATQSVTVTVTAVAPLVITASAGTGGTIAPVGSVSVNQGSNQTFTIAPNAGYIITGVTVDGASAGAVPSYTFPSVQTNHTISAAFAPIPTAVITASPSSIATGDQSTITWSSTNASSCTGTNFSTGGLTSNATGVVVTPAVTTTYSLSCIGAGGTVVTNVSVVVNNVSPAPTLSFTGGTFAWNGTDATSCTASGGWNGSQPVNGSYNFALPSNGSYALTCAGPGGTISRTLTISGDSTQTVSTKFAIGASITTTSGLNVRSSASLTASILGTQATGATGSIIGGPVNAGGYWWWQVNYDTGADGWSVENYLQ
jgi:parallel beta-helix repeat protein